MTSQPSRVEWVVASYDAGRCFSGFGQTKILVSAVQNMELVFGVLITIDRRPCEWAKVVGSNGQSGIGAETLSVPKYQILLFLATQIETSWNVYCINLRLTTTVELHESNRTSYLIQVVFSSFWPIVYAEQLR